MLLNFLIFIIIVALAAVLGNLLLSAETTLSQARARVRSVNNAVAKLEGDIRRHQRDEHDLNAEIAKLGEQVTALVQRQEEVQRQLAGASLARRPRLLVLNDRRSPNDKDWLVVLANVQIGEIEASNPLAQVWREGRPCLVWAESERDATDRALRRFSGRPGFEVRSVKALPADLLRQSARGR